jgi:outer membrane autotransporter protein
MHTMTSHGPIAGKWRLRTMAGAGMLFMPLVSQASDLLWTERSGGFANAPTLPRQVSDYTALARATYASLSATQQQADMAHAQDAPATQALANAQVLPAAGMVRADPKHEAENTAQIAAYATTPAAFFAYGNQMQDGLHQRLGEVRNIMPVDDIGGELFVRYNGSQFNVGAGAGSSKDGYDFKQQANAVQLGGSVVGWNNEGANLRAGWAYDQGTVRVAPKKSGAGYTNYQAKGMSLWVTAQRDNGLYLDIVAGHRRFDGRIQDDAGNSSAKVRASGWAASVEAGLPAPINDSLTIEPQAQLTYQSLRINPIESASGMITRSNVNQQTTARIGIRLAKTDNERFVPYAKVDLSKHFGGQTKVASYDASNRSQTLDGVGPGTSIGFSAGMTVNVTRMVDFYGDVGVQRRMGDRGVNGLAGNAGVWPVLLCSALSLEFLL